MKVLKLNLCVLLNFSLLFGLLVIKIHATEPELKFHRLSVEDGLSHGAVSDIYQDQNGFMWFATRDGLNYYDGYSFHVLRNVLEDSTSLPNNVVNVFAEDKDKNLWIGTNGGYIAKFNPANLSFKNYNLAKYSDRAVSNAIVKTICVAKNGLLWVGTTQGGIFSFDPFTEKLTYHEIPFSHVNKSKLEIVSIYEDKYDNLWIGSVDKGVVKFNPNKNEQSHYNFSELANTVGIKTVTCFDEDNKNTLWLGTYEGLIEHNQLTGEFKHYPVLDKLGTSNAFERITDILFDKYENLWLTTNGGGLIKLHLPTKEFTNYLSIKTNNNSISYNTTTSLYFDKNKNLWIGTFGKGINVLFEYSKNFVSIEFDSELFPEVSIRSVRTITPEDENSFWVGGYNGFLLYDKQRGIIKNASYYGEKRKIEKITKYLFNNTIYSSIKDPIKPEQYIWLGSEGGGLTRFDYLKNEFLNFFDLNTYLDEHTFGTQVFKLAVSPENNIWVGTNKGLSIINPTDLINVHYRNNPTDTNSIFEGAVISIYFDSQKRIWVGGQVGGFALFDNNVNKIKQYNIKPGNKDWLRSNTIYSFHEDSQKRFWIATDRGLHRFYPDQEKFEIYNTESGLPSEIVYSILEDDNGLLWLSTNKGLSRFDPETKVFGNYLKEDGLQGGEFNAGAFAKGIDGTLYFGGTNGLTYFLPEQIQINPFFPNVVLTEIKIIGDEPITINHPVGLETLELDHTDNVVIFEFAALNFQSPHLNRYKYKIEGLYENWIMLEDNRVITITNPPSGEYEFRVIASNNDGIWNEEGLRLKLIIHPPFWLTWWFVFLIIIIIIGIIAAIFKFRMAAIHNKKIELEKLVKERTEKLEKSQIELTAANDSKDKLFSIIAHDMKNPFNSLLGFSEMLSEDFEELSDQEKKDAIAGIADASKEAFSLLENLLDWSRLQMDRIEFHKETFEINSLIQQNVNLLKIALNNKNIKVKLNLDENSEIYADKNMINTVIRNLLTNAIKFSNEGGEIQILTEARENQLIAEVRDFGIGMNDNTINNLLTHSQIKSTLGTSGEKGTGLGIILCKEFIERNNGEFKIESKPGAGSKFSFSLPSK